MRLKFHIDMEVNFNENGNKSLKDMLTRIPSKEFKKYAEEQIIEDIGLIFAEDNEVDNVDIKAKCVIKHN